MIQNILQQIIHMKRIAFLLCTLSIVACKSTRQISQPQTEIESIQKDNENKKEYRGSNTLYNDIIHQRLEVSFDWDKMHLFGEATLDIKPYFKPVSYLILDARGMEIHELALVKNQNKFSLNYTYANDSLIISLDREYTRHEKYQIYIKYTSKPEELKEGGSSAISSDKGLYFINPNGVQKNKPRQIWTQGETESNSVWFPTIDSPNERLTQEIYITVDTAFATLSNGLLLQQTVNHNGTRTDYWKQNVPAAPYLTMMAIGKFYIQKDKWRTIDVDYYVENAYAGYAQNIFGNTPEMIEFFSNKLGVSFPWEKYSQVVVRDYVSGAMENASAVIFGEFMHQNDRERLDGDFEDVISHELFHHWFGDLVTCESWSNIPLNESFATYGEYLWNEYKYGRSHADYNLNNNLSQYKMGAKQKQVELIRYHYDAREDMFDVFSYQKGGHVLHMLRKYTGDDVFFSALNLYLEKNKYKTVEIHQLRLAFEEVSGEDLQWFFNQWFLKAGHPELEIVQQYDSLANEIVIHATQSQSKDWPTYIIPMDIDIYVGGVKSRKRIVISEREQDIRLSFEPKPDLVHLDAERMLLGEISIKYTKEEWMNLLKYSPLYLDKYESLNKLAKAYATDPEVKKLLFETLNNPYYQIRKQVLKFSDKLVSEYADTLQAKLIAMAQFDKKSIVRNEALQSLQESFNDSLLIDVANVCIYDSSYQVSGTALEIIIDNDEQQGLMMAETFEKLDDRAYDQMLSKIFADKNVIGKTDFYKTALARNSGFDIFGLTQNFNKYVMADLENRSPEAISSFEEVARNAEPWYLKIPAIQGINNVRNKLKESVEALPDSAEHLVEKNKLSTCLEQYQHLFQELKESETNEQLKKIFEELQ